MFGCRNSVTGSEIGKSLWGWAAEERDYTTRGSTVVGLGLEGGKQGGDEENHYDPKNSSGSMKKLVWPKLCIGLSSKEKEEDFMAMKGCRLPQRPKKRAKLIQRTLLVSLCFLFSQTHISFFLSFFSNKKKKKKLNLMK